MKFAVANPEFEAEKLYGYIKNVTRSFDDFMFTKLKIKISREIYNSIKSGKNEIELKEELTRVIKTNKKKRLEIERNLPKIRDDWKKIEGRLFSTIKELTGRKVDKNFTCQFLTAYRSGGYEDKTNRIWIYYDRKKKFWGVTHELLHIHCWKIWNKLFKNCTWGESWKFSEVYVELLLRDTTLSFIIPKEERKLKFWKEVEPMAKKVIPLWQKRNSFEEFLVESFKKLKLKGKLK